MPQGGGARFPKEGTSESPQIYARGYKGHGTIIYFSCSPNGKIRGPTIARNYSDFHEILLKIWYPRQLFHILDLIFLIFAHNEQFRLTK